jgi:hypothetical protein
MDRGETAEAQNKWVFEIAWEVANKGWYFYERELDYDFIGTSDLQWLHHDMFDK